MSFTQTKGEVILPEKDYNHATDGEYKKLRNRADQAYKEKQKLSQQSQAAYKKGDKSRAHELSTKAKEKLEEAEGYNIQAAEYVFVANNADSKSYEIDLHGLYVKEAKWILQRRVAGAVKSGESELHVIVGKGLHSSNGIAKLKPAIQELCDEANLNDHIDPKNNGLLIIDLKGARIPTSWDTVGYIPYLKSQNEPTKPQSGYSWQQQPQYQQHYQNFSQPTSQYYPQQHEQQGVSSSQQHGASQTNNQLVGTLLKLLCSCINKNL